MIPDTWIQQARSRLRNHILCTPLTHDPELDLFLKWENQQVTGSFKVRGAINKAMVLESWERQAGLLTASAGNHGLGVALAGRLLDAPVVVYASQNAVPTKLEAMRALGAELRLVPGGYGEAETAALEEATQSALTWVSAYNDGQVIAGQGTLADETLEQLQRYPAFELQASTWLIPVGGGGLLAGVASGLQKQTRRPRIVGVQTDSSPFMHSLYQLGSQAGVQELASIADGLAGPVEAGAITIPIIQQLADDLVLVSEAELRKAVAYAWQRYGQRIEGSAATVLAAVLSGKIKARPAVLLISGGNIQPQVLQEILAQHPPTSPEQG